MRDAGLRTERLVSIRNGDDYGIVFAPRLHLARWQARSITLIVAKPYSNGVHVLLLGLSDVQVRYGPDAIWHNLASCPHHQKNEPRVSQTANNRNRRFLEQQLM